MQQRPFLLESQEKQVAKLVKSNVQGYLAAEMNSIAKSEMQMNYLSIIHSSIVHCKDEKIHLNLRKNEKQIMGLVKLGKIQRKR